MLTGCETYVLLMRRGWPIIIGVACGQLSWYFGPIVVIVGYFVGWVIMGSM